MPYRLIYLGLALVAVAAIALGVALSREGESVELPAPVESVSPSPGDLVPPQTTLEIDLEVGYAAEIFVDGWPVTDASFVEATGVYRWSPSPTHPTIQQWAPGEHTVRIVWDTYTGLPDRGSFEWTFRVG
ncbi:MAG: hypothetical protein KY394_01735 [Actinobacteria bacterium]|nr:hypothetical protein [Actinomycetota bacterium]